MVDLVSGDAVATSAGIERVVLSQHREASLVAELVRIETSEGAAITVTSDHVLFIDGAFVPAARAAVGSTLSTGIVSKLVRTSGLVVNPITPSGTILTADTSAPTRSLLAATHPEWIASFLLSSPLFPAVATRALSHIAPVTTQAQYTAAEPYLTHILPALKRAAHALPPPALAVGVVACDFMFAASVIFALSLPLLFSLALAGSVGLLLVHPRKSIK